MTTLKPRFGALALAFAIFFAGIGAGFALGAQTHMENALGYLNSALNELNQAATDKGGHRQNAINQVKAAINQVNLGIQYGAGH